VPEEELSRRKKEWTPPERPEEKGLLARYSRMVGAARKGAVLP